MKCQRCKGTAVPVLLHDEHLTLIKNWKCVNCGWEPTEATPAARAAAHAKVAEHDRQVALGLAYRSAPKGRGRSQKHSIWNGKARPRADLDDRILDWGL